MQRTVIPLYLRRADFANGIPSALTLDLMPEEEAVLITRDSLPRIMEELGEFGVPRFHVFDTAMEAVSAEIALNDDSRRSRGHPLETEVGALRDGEGVLMAINDARAITRADFPIHDHRSDICRPVEIAGSWELTEAECRTLMGPETLPARHDLATAVAGKLARMPVESVKNLQIALERVPGAYVGWLSLCVDDIRSEAASGLPGIAGLPDADIHAIMTRSASKVDMPEAFREVVEDVLDRIAESRPDLAEEEATAGPPGF